jgi:hypothetical protein
MQPSVAIIILNFNGKHLLERFLPSVVSITYTNCSIWVVDNHSTDGSCAWLKERYPAVHLLETPANKGFVGGYNFAFQYIDAEYILLLNNDVEVEPDFVQPLVSQMESDARWAMIQPKMRNEQQRHLFDYAGAAGGFIDSLGYPFCRGRLLEKVEEDKGQYNDVSRLFWATGGCCCIRASYYRKLGGMYSYLFMQNEDIDLCWRFQLAGYFIGYCPDSVVYHVGGGSLSWVSPRKVFFTFRNNLIVLTRNMPISRLLWLIPLRHLLDFAAAGRYVLQGKSGHGLAVLKGGIAYWKWLLFLNSKSTLGEDKWPGKRSLKRCYGVFRGSIIWSYFVKKSTAFLQLPAQNKW